MPSTHAFVGLALFQSIVTQIPDAVIFADGGGVIRVWNGGAEAVFGFRAAEAVGASLDIIIPARLRAAHWEAYSRAMASGHTRNGAQVRTTRANHKDGSRLYVDLSFAVVVNEVGAVLGSVAVGRDVTVRHLSDAALRSRLTDLEERIETCASRQATAPWITPPTESQ
jgi:PAS domain S-box-containing protein